MYLKVETTVTRIITYYYNDDGHLSVVDSTDPISNHTILEMKHEETITNTIPKQPSSLLVRV